MDRFGVLGVLAATLFFLFSSGRSSDHGAIKTEARAPILDAPRVPTEKPRVRSLEVRHYAAVDAKTTKPRGVIGRDSFTIHLDDEIEAKVVLDRPAYCYLIIFRPDGKDAVLYPQDDADIPELTDTVVYPAKRPNERYYLEKEEMAGLWLVAAYVSETPLPPYTAWRQAHPGSPWKGITAVPKNLVSMHDGYILETRDQAGRGSKVSRDKSIVADMVQWLKAQGASTAAAVGFPVEAAQK